MAVTYPDRAVIRKAIAAKLATALTGQATVVDYLMVDPGGKSPIVYVASASSAPDEFNTQYGGVFNISGFTVGILVIYSQGAWTPAMCEDKSDALAKLIFETIDNNAVNVPVWSKLTAAGPSEPQNAVVGGNRYRIELIPVAAMVATGNN